MTEHEYLAAKKEWQALRNQAFDISVQEAKEERLIHEWATTQRAPILAHMRDLEQRMAEYVHAKHKGEAA